MFTKIKVCISGINYTSNGSYSEVIYMRVIIWLRQGKDETTKSYYIMFEAAISTAGMKKITATTHVDINKTYKGGRWWQRHQEVSGDLPHRVQWLWTIIRDIRLYRLRRLRLRRLRLRRHRLRRDRLRLWWLRRYGLRRRWLRRFRLRHPRLRLNRLRHRRLRPERLRHHWLRRSRLSHSGT